LNQFTAANIQPAVGMFIFYIYLYASMFRIILSIVF